MKSVTFQNYLVLSLVSAIIMAALLAHSQMPLIGVLGGFVGSVLTSRIFFHKKWKRGFMDEVPVWKRYLLGAIASLIGAQIGWVALLI